jgi:acyl carrier protein
MKDGPIEPVVREFIESRFRAAIRGRDVADASLFSTGIIDSFGVLELIAFLEDTFHVDIDPARYELTEFDTIAKIAALVGRLQQRAEPS